MRNTFPTVQTQNYGETETAAQTVAVKEVRQFVERMERLVEQRQAVNSDLSSLREEIKGAGYDAKGIGAIVRLRANEQKLKADYQTVEMYASAMGIDLFGDSPLPETENPSADDAVGRFN